MDRQRAFTIVTMLCVLISTTFLVLGCIAIWKNHNYAGANHSWLFGTSTERVLMKYSIAIPLIASMPLFVSVFLRRNFVTIVMCLCGLALYFFLRVLLITLTD